MFEHKRVMPYRHLGLALFTIVMGCEYEVAPRYDGTTDFTMIGSTSAVVHFDIKADRPQRTMSTSAPIRTLHKPPATDVSTPRRRRAMVLMTMAMNPLTKTSRAPAPYVTTMYA